MDAHDKSVYIIDTHWHKMCSHKGHTDTKCVHIRDTHIYINVYIRDTPTQNVFT